jgi:hypothetical protein
MNSRAKGKRGELAVAHLFRDYGYPAERGQQHDGLSGHADVVGIPYIWIEVKWRENLNIESAIRQAERDSAAYLDRTGESLLPVVIYKKNRQPWRVAMRPFDFSCLMSDTPFVPMWLVKGHIHMLFSDWIEIYQAYEKGRTEK